MVPWKIEIFWSRSVPSNDEKIFDWPGRKKTIEDFSEACNTRQKNKITSTNKYDMIPLAKDLNKFNPWEYVYVDIIVPCNINYKLMKQGTIITVKLSSSTIVDRACIHTRCVTIAQYHNIWQGMAMLISKTTPSSSRQ